MSRGALAAYGLALAAALAASVATQQRPATSALPSVQNTGPRGLAVLAAYLAEGGTVVHALREPGAAVPGEVRTLVLAPSETQALGEAEVRALQAFAEGGGTVVLLAPRGAERVQPELAAWLGLGEGPRVGADVLAQGASVEDPLGATVPVWVRGGLVAGARALRVERAPGVQVEAAGAMPLAGSGAAVVLWRVPSGRGEVYVASGADLAESRRLSREDNRRLWDAVAARGPVAFDERPLLPRGPAPGSRALAVFGVQLLVVGGVFALSRAPRFGPVRPLVEVRHRATREAAVAMGRLARRAGVERELAAELGAELRRLLLERGGVPLGLPAEEASRAAAAALGVPAAEVLAVLRSVEAAAALPRLSARGYARVARQVASLELLLSGRGRPGATSGTPSP